MATSSARYLTPPRPNGASPPTSPLTPLPPPRPSIQTNKRKHGEMDKSIVQKRNLPARLGRASGSSSGLSMRLAGNKEVEEIVMDAFARAYESQGNVPSTFPIHLTSEPFNSIRPSLLPHSALSSYLHEPAQSQNAIASSSQTPDRKGKRRESTLTGKDPIRGQAIPTPTWRLATEADDVIGSEKDDGKRKTRGALGLMTSPTKSGTNGSMEANFVVPIDLTADSLYIPLHRRCEIQETRYRLKEREKISHEKYKLSGRVNMLIAMDQVGWEGCLGRIVKAAERIQELHKQRVKQKREAERVEAQKLAGWVPDGTAKKEDPIEPETEQEVYQRKIMAAGLQLVKRRGANGFKRDLVKEGEELLGKYDRVLNRSATQSIDPPFSRRSQSHDHLHHRARTSASPAPHPLSISDHPRQNGRSRRRRSTAADEDAMDVDEEEQAGDVSIEDVEDLDAKLEMSDDDPEVEDHQEILTQMPTRRTLLRIPARSSPSIPSARGSLHNASHRQPIPSVPTPMRMEAFIAPTTQSGKPALLEAADKRLSILSNTQAKPRTGKDAEEEAAKRESRCSRYSAVLPFGTPIPSILSWKIAYDLDGEVWNSWKNERGYEMEPRPSTGTNDVDMVGAEQEAPTSVEEFAPSAVTDDELADTILVSARRATLAEHAEAIHEDDQSDHSAAPSSSPESEGEEVQEAYQAKPRDLIKGKDADEIRQTRSKSTATYGKRSMRATVVV